MIVVSEIFREQEKNGFIMYVLFVVTSSEYLWKSALINTRLSSWGTVTDCHGPISFCPFLSGVEQTPTQSPSPTPHAPTMSPSSPHTIPTTSATWLPRSWPWDPGNDMKDKLKRPLSWACMGRLTPALEQNAMKIRVSPLESLFQSSHDRQSVTFQIHTQLIQTQYV